MDMIVSDSLACVVYPDDSLSYELCFNSEVIFVSAAMHAGDFAWQWMGYRYLCSSLCCFCCAAWADHSISCELSFDSEDIFVDAAILAGDCLKLYVPRC